MLIIGILVLVLMGAIRKELGIKMMSRLTILVLIGALMLKYNIYSETYESIIADQNPLSIGYLTLFNGLLRIDTLGTVIELFIYIVAMLLILMYI